MKPTVLIALAASLLIYGEQANAQSALKSGPNDPLSVTGYRIESARASDPSLRDEIRHTVTLKNTSSKEVVAFQLRFLLFNAFNECFKLSSGYSLEPLPADQETSGEWRVEVKGEPITRENVTGIAYVSAVRFADGIVWKADEQRIVEQIKSVQSDFTIGNLKAN